MKAVSKKTGNVVEVASKNERTFYTTDGTSYLAEDFEFLEEVDGLDQIRVQAAIAAMQGILANQESSVSKVDVVNLAVQYADALIEKLKE